eukprot:921161-Rhodomonas_salina.2
MSRTDLAVDFVDWVSNTDLAYYIRCYLCACYAMSGTDLAHAATRKLSKTPTITLQLPGLQPAHVQPQLIPYE